MRRLIPLLALVPLPALGGGTAGLSPGVWAWQTSARHAMMPSIGVWATHTSRPWSITGELAGSLRTRGVDTYRYRAGHLRLSGVFGVAAGTHATTMHLGLGPAVSTRLGAMTYGDERVSLGQVEVGGRLRLALDGPLGGRVGWSWHVAATSRGWLAVDYDTALGLGVAW